MKIPSEKLKPFTTEIAPECSKLIANLRNTGDVAAFAKGLDSITEFCSAFGKSELGRWAEVLNDCDLILESAATLNEDETMAVDVDDSLEVPLVSVLRFTSLLFENTFGRSVYSSMEKLIRLLDSRKIWIVVQTLRLLMVISKSSRFITQHLGSDLRIEIYNKLMAILEVWAGKFRVTPFAEFCSADFSYSQSMSIQINPEMEEFVVDTNKALTVLNSELKKTMADSTADLQTAEKTFAFTKLRFLYSIRNQNERFYQLLARLISTSIIFYSRCLMIDESRLNGLANEQFIEQCCSVLNFEPPPKCQTLTDSLKTEALKTLASIVFLEKAKKIQFIVDTFGLRTYHGFCPSLVRTCIERLKAGKLEATGGDFSMSFVTSLFSLVYHIAGFEYGGNALNQASLVPVLLSVVKTYTLPEQYISYVTRSVRIIDILTGMDVAQFNTNDGTTTIVERFSHEVQQCKTQIAGQPSSNTTLLCSQQRSALMKSLMNFIKRAVLDANLAGQMRRIMDTELPHSLIFIIQHPQYFGPSLLHCALTLTTNFIYQEPAQLTALQNIGLTDSIMNLIFDEKFPISRDLVCALSTVCSALCLNERGHNEFKQFNNQKPLERIFNIIFSNKFLLSMRKRKTEILETAQILGNSFDELVRHHPVLRKDVMTTISKLIDEFLEQSSSEEKCVSWSMGRALVEDDSVEHVPLGDYMAILGVMIETMLSNRTIQDNVQTMSELGIPIRLVKLLSQAKKPNPVLLNSSFLPNLANILCCLMRQSYKVDEAFAHLVERCSFEMGAYLTIKEGSQEKLFQLTRLSSLVSTLNILMKSLVHTQGSYDIRPFLLHFFAADTRARDFVTSLFNTYKLMSSDKLFNAAQQTTSQILEDTTKVRDLLRIDDGLGQDAQMEVDAPPPPPTMSATTTSPSLQTWFNADGSIFLHPSLLSIPRFHVSIQENRQAQNEAQAAAQSSSSTAYANVAARNVNSVDSVENTTTAPSSSAVSVLTERSAGHVTYRCHRQIGELIACIGKNFCSAGVLKLRQRASTQLIVSQETLKKDFREMCTLIFCGVQRLLQPSDRERVALSSLYLNQPLSLLKKFLIDDNSQNNTQQLLPDFYLSGCYRTFLSLVNEHFLSDIIKENFAMTIHSWLNIAQKLSSTHLASNPKNGSQPKVVVEGFELKNFLATAQKNIFAEICAMLTKLMTHCEMFSTTSGKKEGSGRGEEEAVYKMLEKLMDCLKLLLKDMMKLLELTEGTNEGLAEIPVNEIDPQKIQQLVEMGFSQSDAVDALLVSSSVPEAAEYLVSMMERNTMRQRSSPAAAISTAAAAASTQTSTTATAIAAEVVATATVEAAVAAKREDSSNASSDDLKQKQQSSGSSTRHGELLSALKPLSRDDLQETVEFVCKNIVPQSLRLLDKNRSIVLSLGELIAIFAEDHVACSWVDGELVGLLIGELSEKLEKISRNEKAEEEGEEGGKAEAESVRKFSSLLHLFCLVWQNYPNQRIYKRVFDKEKGGNETSSSTEI